MALDDLFPALFDNYFIKVIFLVHAILLFLADLAIPSSGYGPVYTNYSNIILICILLSIVVERNVDIILVTTALNAVSILFDLILLILGITYGHFWALLFVIANLLFKPISTILLLKNYTSRAGVDDPTSGILEVNVATHPNTSTSAAQPRSLYHNIDQPNQSLP